MLLRVPNYFEDAASIAKAGGLDAELFYESFAGVAADEWAVWGPAVKELQKGDPLIYVEFEALAKKAQAEDAARGAASADVGPSPS